MCPALRLDHPDRTAPQHRRQHRPGEPESAVGPSSDGAQERASTAAFAAATRPLFCPRRARLLVKPSEICYLTAFPVRVRATLRRPVVLGGPQSPLIDAVRYGRRRRAGVRSCCRREDPVGPGIVVEGCLQRAGQRPVPPSPGRGGQPASSSVLLPMRGPPGPTGSWPVVAGRHRHHRRHTPERSRATGHPTGTAVGSASLEHVIIKDSCRWDCDRAVIADRTLHNGSGVPTASPRPRERDFSGEAGREHRVDPAWSVQLG